jgi:hypothetical protein
MTERVRWVMTGRWSESDQKKWLVLTGLLTVHELNWPARLVRRTGAFGHPDTC